MQTVPSNHTSLQTIPTNHTSLQTIPTNRTSLQTVSTIQPDPEPVIWKKPLKDEAWKTNKALQMLIEGKPSEPNNVIIFSPNVWAGFCNNFRTIRGLALYSILKGFKLRSGHSGFQL